MRLAPHALTAAAAISVAMIAGRAYQPAQAEEVPAMSSAQMAAMEARAFAAANAPAGLTAPEAVPVQIRRGETFEQAVRRTGVAPAEASAVAATVANAFDLADLRAGLKFETAIARPRDGRGDARLIGLTMRTGPASQLTVSRSFDGALRLRSLEEKVTHETVVLKGDVERSLSASARELGATASIVRSASRLFATKFDMQRDIRATDEFTMVFDRDVTEAGRTVNVGDLMYAELRGVTFYRFKPAGAKEPQFFDANGKNLRSAMMRTPLQSFRRVSSNFGFRTHPISGYKKMHQGIDFAAGTGTPVVAPADGRGGGGAPLGRLRKLAAHPPQQRAGKRLRPPVALWLGHSRRPAGQPGPDRGLCRLHRRLDRARTCTMNCGATASGSIRPACAPRKAPNWPAPTWPPSARKRAASTASSPRAARSVRRCSRPRPRVCVPRAAKPAPQPTRRGVDLC